MLLFFNGAISMSFKSISKEIVGIWHSFVGVEINFDFGPLFTLATNFFSLL